MASCKSIDIENIDIALVLFGVFEQCVKCIVLVPLLSRRARRLFRQLLVQVKHLSPMSSQISALLFLMGVRKKGFLIIIKALCLSSHLICMWCTHYTALLARVPLPSASLCIQRPSPVVNSAGLILKYYESYVMIHSWVIGKDRFLTNKKINSWWRTDSFARKLLKRIDSRFLKVGYWPSTSCKFMNAFCAPLPVLTCNSPRVPSFFCTQLAKKDMREVDPAQPKARAVGGQPLTQVFLPAGYWSSYFSPFQKRSQIFWKCDN